MEWIALSPDGLYLATVSKGVATIWDLKQRRSARLATSPVHSVAFSGDSKHIAVVEETATPESCLKKESSPTGHTVHVLKLARGTGEIAIANEGRFIAVVGLRRIRIWDTVTCGLSGTLEEKEAVTAIAFDETSGLVAASTAQGSAQVWKVPAGERVYRIHHEGYLASVAFSTVAKRQYLVTPNGYVTRQQGEYAPNPRNTARLWPWRQEDILGGACSVLVTYDSHQFPQDPDFDASLHRVCPVGH